VRRRDFIKALATGTAAAVLGAAPRQVEGAVTVPRSQYLQALFHEPQTGTGARLKAAWLRRHVPEAMLVAVL